MKLLNFANLNFRLEEKKRILFYAYCIDFKYRFKYWFYYPSSFYFEIDPDITQWKNYYHSNFINQFKQLKKNIEDETSKLR